MYLERKSSKISPLIFRHAMGHNFDGVDFALDAAFGASAILGVGWIASVVI